MVRVYFTATCILLLLRLSSACFAIDKEWNLAADGTWNTAVNWSPNGVPTSADFVYLGRSPFPQGFLTTLDINATVAGLTMRNASDFATGGFQLTVNGLTTVAGTGSVFTVDPRTAGDLDGLDSEGLLIENNGLVSLTGGILELESGSLDIMTGGASGSGGLGGYGTIELVQGGLAGAQVFNNSGRLFVAKNAFAIGGTLTITNTDTDSPLTVGDGTVDLDGDSEAGVVDVDDSSFGVASNLTLVVDAALTDAFSGEMLIGQGDTIDIRRAWTMTDGDVQLNGSAGTATLVGSPLTVSGGSTINVNSGVGAIESNLTFNNGSINVATGTTLRLGGNANINLGNAILLNGASTLHVTGTTAISDTTRDFDWDGGGSATTRVSGQLSLNVDHVDIGNDTFDGTIDLVDNGDLTVTVSDGQWNLGPNATLYKNNSGLSSVSGSRILVDQGSLVMRAGTLEINPDIDFASGAAVVVDPGATGRLDGESTFMAGSQLLINGTLNVIGPSTWQGPALVGGSGTIVNLGLATIAEDTTISVDTADWDGGTTFIDDGRSLTFNVNHLDQGNDIFNNVILNYSGALTVDVADDSWTLGSAALLDLFNTTGASPTLHGDRVVLENGGRIRSSGGDAEIHAPVTVNDGSDITVIGPNRLQLHGPTTLNGGDLYAVTLGAIVAQFGALTVTAPSTILAETYNWDQAPTTIESGGELTLQIEALDLQPGERYDNLLTLNSGRLHVDNAANEWTVDQRLVMNNTTGVIPRISGEKLHIGDGVGTSDANVEVGGTGVSAFDVPVDYHADAAVVVSSGAILRHNEPTTFLGGGSYSGDGILDFADDTTVSGATTVDMANGTVDLDGPNTDQVGDAITVAAPLTLNVGTLTPFGKNNTTGTNSIGVDGTAGGVLTVNLTDPAGSWRVTPQGQVVILNGNVPATVLAGSDVDMDGTLSLAGDARTTARMLIGGTVNILSVGEPFRLEGGSLANPNRLEGGTVSGPGFLLSTAGHALYGFGAIDADVDFGANAELKAENGLLTVTGAVLDVGEIGTANTTGVLEVSNPWNTNVTNLVRLAGGELLGGDVTNDGPNGIRGHGRIAARVVNNSMITADVDTLVLDNDTSDYDGAAGTGVLDASNGNLEIRDDATFGFGGTARVGSNQNAFVNGFRMNFNAPSAMQLTGGTWQSTAGMNLAGALTVNAGNASTIDVDEDLTFVNGSNTTLIGNLRVEANPAIVQVGASFTGGGDVVNRHAGTMRLNNGATMGVGIRNEGILQLGNSAAARGDVADFIQMADGTLEIDLAGTGINQLDRLVLSGAAQLDGALNVSLLNGFVPSLGDSFSFLTAVGGVSGTFLFENLPALGNGLALDVAYNPDSVVLQVIQALSPDFDMDGDVDGSDVDLLVMEIVGMTNGSIFDLTGDGTVNHADLVEWLDQAGAINLASGNSYIMGDASLDGFVDGSDFGAWNANKFTMNARWTLGDFNADGFIDGSDFGTWNANKFTSADGSAQVPEPSGYLVCAAGILLLAGRKSRIIGRYLANRHA